MLIGIDFDNTLICYDAVFRALATESGLLGPDEPVTKHSLRAAARRTSEGDIAWQRLQAEAYGPRILQAQPAPGCLAFLARCRHEGVPVRLISHKTEFAAQDATGTNLRQAALSWLEANGFFGPGMPLEVKHCRFADSRQGKTAYMAEEGCTHFIDDLEETFLEPSFPPHIQPVLYEPGRAGLDPLPGFHIVHTWAEAEKVVFGFLAESCG